MKKLAALLVFLLLPIHPAIAAVPTGLEIEIHQLVNQVRLDKESHGQDLQPLKLHSLLIQVARDHSQDMIDRNYFAHQSPDGDQVWDRVEAVGISYTSVGENLYESEGIPEADFAESAVDGWVNSPGHYANMIGQFTYTGIGVASSGNLIVVTQVFLSANQNSMEALGTIYDNDALTAGSDSSTSGFSFELSTPMIAGIIILLVILVGIDANRRNQRYYGRR